MNVLYIEELLCYRTCSFSGLEMHASNNWLATVWNLHQSLLNIQFVCILCITQTHRAVSTLHGSPNNSSSRYSLLVFSWHLSIIHMPHYLYFWIIAQFCTLVCNKESTKHHFKCTGKVQLMDIWWTPTQCKWIQYIGCSVCVEISRADITYKLWFSRHTPVSLFCALLTTTNLRAPMTRLYTKQLPYYAPKQLTY